VEAQRIWQAVNEPNLLQNILPTRGRATLVLQKGDDHVVRRVRLRKL
jgi:type I pantothenate kinase